MKTEMSSFQPHFIFNFPGYESVGRSQGHEFPSRLVCGKGFLSSFIEEEESVLKSRKEGFTKGGGRCKVHIHREWRMEISWWSYAVWSYGGQQTIRIVPRIEGCWCRRCRDRF